MKWENILLGVLITICIAMLCVFQHKLTHLPTYSCVEWGEPELVCHKHPVCKAPGVKMGQCWLYEHEETCRLEDVCVKKVCVKNCN